jgi:hypothetical protein
MPDAVEVAREAVLQGATSDPAAVSWGSGRIDLFVRGADNAIWHKYFANSQWSAWVSLGGALASGPAVSSWGAGRLDVFARGTDNTLQHTWYAQGWAGRWESLGGGITADPAAVAWGVNRMDVFVRGTDNALYHKWFDGAWSGWEGLGGVLASGPAVSTWGPDRLDVFVRGTDNALHHTWYDRGWSGTWESLGGSSIPIRPLSRGVGTYRCLCPGSDNVLKHRWWAGSWSSWENLGVRRVRARRHLMGRRATRRLRQGSDNAVAQMTYSGAWSGWTSIESQTTAPTPTVPVSVTGTPSALVVSWPAVTNVEYYKIDRFKENDTCCNRSVMVIPPATSTTDAVSSSLEGAYQYRVSAMMPSRAMVILQGSYYVYGKLDVELAPPINRTGVTILDPCAPAETTGGAPPATVTASQSGATLFVVLWQAVPGAAAYLVERGHRTNTALWFKLGCLPATTTMFSETTRSDLSPDETPYPSAPHVHVQDHCLHFHGRRGLEQSEDVCRPPDWPTLRIDGEPYRQLGEALLDGTFGRRVRNATAVQDHHVVRDRLLRAGQHQYVRCHVYHRAWGPHGHAQFQVRSLYRPFPLSGHVGTLRFRFGDSVTLAGGPGSPVLRPMPDSR